jgi:hypothetical protein
VVLIEPFKDPIPKDWMIVEFDENPLIPLRGEVSWDFQMDVKNKNDNPRGDRHNVYYIHETSWAVEISRGRSSRTEKARTVE